MSWMAIRAALARVPVSAWLALALFAALLVQTTRIEGLKVWPVHIEGLKAELVDTKQQLADTKAAFAKTVANYRTAADQARQADAANAARVKAEQARINERTSDEYEARIADARARAERLRSQVPQAGADSGGRGAAPVPGVSSSPGGSAEAAGEGGLPSSDALTATEQAIQLDELIKWVLQQHAVDVNGQPGKP